MVKGVKGKGTEPVTNDLQFETDAAMAGNAATATATTTATLRGGRRKFTYYGGWRDNLYLFFVYFFLVLALVVILFPILFIVASSFSSAESIAAGRVLFWPVKFSVEGYQMILRTSAIKTGFANSVKYMVVGTCINLVMTMLIAYPLSRRDFQAKWVVTTIMTVTMFFNGGLIPTYLLMRDLHLLDTFWVMVLPTAISVWNVIIMRTFIQSTIPNELHECATLEGCGDFSFLLRIVIPLSTPIIAVIGLLYAVGHWNTYFNAMIYLSSSERFPLQLVLRDILILNMGVGNPNDVQRQQEMLMFSYLLRYSTIIVASLPMMIIYPFVQKYFVKGIMIGAIKG